MTCTLTFKLSRVPDKKVKTRMSPCSCTFRSYVCERCSYTLVQVHSLQSIEQAATLTLQFYPGTAPEHYLLWPRRAVVGRSLRRRPSFGCSTFARGIGRAPAMQASCGYLDSYTAQHYCSSSSSSLTRVSADACMMHKYAQHGIGGCAVERPIQAAAGSILRAACQLACPEWTSK